MRECFLITTFCDTDKKISILRKTINTLKKYDIDICVHAHYPLSFDIQQSIQYYIYDDSNPIIPLGVRSIIMWRRYNNCQFNILKRDYGYTVVSQWKYGLLFLKNVGFDVVHVLNYDTIITDENMEKSKQIKDYSGVFYLNSDDDMNLLFGTIKPDDYLLENISMDDYVGMNEFWYAEKYFFNLLKGNNLYLKDKIQHENMRHQLNEFHQYDFEGYSIHAGDRINWIDGEKIYTNKFSFVIYNVNDDIDIKIFMESNLVLHEKTNKFKVIDTEISTKDVEQSFGYYDDNKFVNGDKRITIFINDEKLDDYVTSNFCLSSIEFSV